MATMLSEFEYLKSLRDPWSGLFSLKEEREERHALMCQLNKRLLINLGERECESLALTLCGFSAKHAGKILGLSSRTVEAYLQIAYQELECSGKQVALAMMYKNKTLSLWWDLAKEILEI